jgi:calcineurin-like phosphoesterase family protein
MIFVTSDHHFGHANIIRLCDRPFADVDEMNHAMVDRWNSVVSTEDTVIIGGDFALGKINETIKFAGLLNGKKTLLCGNHDRPFLADAERSDSDQAKRERQQAKYTQQYLDAGFDSVVHGSMFFTYNGITIHMNHFPYKGSDDYDDRYANMRPIDNGQPLVHGHVHEKWRIKSGVNGGLQINMGVDVWDFTPVSIDTIVDLIQQFT